MEPWQMLVLVGAAIAGYGWLVPQTKKGETSEQMALQSDEAYDRLLEDLETENRELVDAVASFKKEQDETVHRLGLRIRELETQMADWASSAATAGQDRSASPAITTMPMAAVEPMRQADAEQTKAAATLGSEQPIQQSWSADAPEEAASLPIAAQSIRVRYAELLELHGRGRSVEQIAKTLGLNKGEVQLILQLAKREEEQHA